MKSDLNHTPLFSGPILSDANGTMWGGTPLVAPFGAEPFGLEKDPQVVIRLNQLLTYQSMISELQQKVSLYKMLWQQATARPRLLDEMSAEPSAGISAVSVRVLDSIISADITTDYLRGYEEDE